MSLKNPFLWRENKSTLKEPTVLPEVHKKHLINTDFMINTKIKGINDQIGVYDTKITKMMNELRQKEEELSYKEKILKDQQRKMTNVVKTEAVKKQFNAMEDDRKAEDMYEKKVKEVSQLASYNIQNRQNIDSLRREKNTYKQINDKLEKEIENLKRNFVSADNQLNELTVNRQILERKIDDETKTLEKDKELAVVGLLTIQQKLSRENRKLKNQFNMTKKSSINPKNVTFNVNPHDNDPNEPRVFDTEGDEIINKQDRFDTERMNETKGSGDNKFANKARYTVQTFKSNVSKDTKPMSQDLEQQEKKIKKRLEELENLFKVLYEVTNTNNMADLTEYYLQLEEENRELYKETKLFIDEMDKMKDQKLAMQMEIKNNANTNEKHTNIKEEIISQIEKKVEEVNDKINIVDSRRDQYIKLVNELKLSLPIILKKLAFESEQVEISPNSIDKQNLTQYLYVLERKTNYILKLVKENNLENHIFDPTLQNPKDNRPDELKWKNDLNVLEDLMSKLKRVWLFRKER